MCSDQSRRHRQNSMDTEAPSPSMSSYMPSPQSSMSVFSPESTSTYDPVDINGEYSSGCEQQNVLLVDHLQLHQLPRQTVAVRPMQHGGGILTAVIGGAGGGGGVETIDGTEFQGILDQDLDDLNEVLGTMDDNMSDLQLGFVIRPESFFFLQIVPR